MVKKKSGTVKKEVSASRRKILFVLLVSFLCLLAVLTFLHLSPFDTAGITSAVVSSLSQTPVYQCLSNSDCPSNHYCFDYQCYAFECSRDSDCPRSDHLCFNHHCILPFDIKLIRADSPIQPGDYLDFTYTMKGMADIQGDVIVTFWLEKDSQIITSGSDTIYLGTFEEKTETTNLFLPSDTPIGNYDFYIQVNYGQYKPITHRIIQVGRRIPLVLDVQLSELPPLQSGDALDFSFTLSLNYDFPVPLRLEEKILRNDEPVWSKEREAVITKSTVIKEKIRGLKPGRYRLELINHYSDKTTTITESFEVKSLAGDYQPYILPFLIGLAAFILIIIFFWERKKIKSGIIKEKLWLKKHKASLALLLFFIVAGCLIYYYRSWLSLSAFSAYLAPLLLWLRQTPYSAYYLSSALGLLIGLLVLFIGLRFGRKIKSKFPLKKETPVPKEKEEKKEKREIKKEIKLKPQIRIKPQKIKPRGPSWLARHKKPFLIFLFVLLAVLIIGGTITYLFYTRILLPAHFSALWFGFLAAFSELGSYFALLFHNLGLWLSSLLLWLRLDLTPFLKDAFSVCGNFFRAYYLYCLLSLAVIILLVLIIWQRKNILKLLKKCGRFLARLFTRHWLLLLIIIILIALGIAGYLFRLQLLPFLDKTSYLVFSFFKSLGEQISLLINRI